jgi:dolichol-phosphate mannosyltransferase
VLRPLAAEVLFVDDSTDSTPAVIRAVAQSSTVPVRLLHRVGAERSGGLGGAVLAGLAQTDADWVVVMDGDLQHPPELIRSLLRRAAETDAGIVVASRYSDDGGADGLSSGLRTVVSRGSTIVAKALFPRALAGVSDPMSGFFLVRRADVPADDLRPMGFKVLLEILVRSRQLAATEIPFQFARRNERDSKASWREGIRYLRQLIRLRLSGFRLGLDFLRFAAVGASGVLVNLLVLQLLLAYPGAPQHGAWRDAAETVATQVAIVWNFALTETWVFGDSKSGSRWLRFAGFWALSVAALAAQLPLANLLANGLNLSYVRATAVALAVLVVVRYVVCRLWFYRGRLRAKTYRPGPAEQAA